MERSCGARVAGVAVALGLWVAVAGAATNVWDGGADTSWTNAVNWTNDTALANGESVEFYSVGNNLGTVLDQDWTIDRLLFNAGADSDVTIGGANTLTISNGITVDADALGTHSILSAVALAQNQTWANNSATNFTVGGVISGDAALTKTGAGFLTLTNQNTFTGGLTLTGGKLRVGHNDALGTGLLTLNAGTTLSSDSATTRLMTNAVTVGGNITLGDATDTGALTFSGPMSLGNAVRTFTVTAVTVTNSGVISGTGTTAGIAKTGTGTMVLAGTNNSFAGAVNIDRATLVVASVANVGTNSSLGTGSGSATVARIRLGSATQSGTLTYIGAGDSTDRPIQIGSANGDTGNATINADGTGALIFTTNNFIVQQAGATVGRTLTLGGAGEGEIRGIIRNNNNAAGTISLTKTGTGTWTLSGTNSSFSGQVFINQGTLTVGSLAGAGTNSSLGAGISSPVIRVGNNNNTGTLNYVGDGDATDRQIQIGSGTVGNTGGAIINNNGTGALVFTATNFNAPFATATGTRTLTLGGTNTGANAILGVIADNVGATTTGKVNVAKSGSGTWILAATNTYTGATTINAGSLIVTGGFAIGDSSAVTISNEATALLQMRSSETIGSLAGGDGIGGAVDLGGYTLTAGGNNSSTIFGGTITNTGSLVKEGTGTMALTNNNTYVGSTTIRGGVLRLDSANALPGGIGTIGGTSALILTNGGTLGLGAGDFTRELGTGPSNVAWTGSGGFSAYGGTRIVNIGGATQTLTWGQPNFMISNDNELVLAAADATGTIDFQNHIVLSGTNRFRADQGAAAIDGRLSGDLSGNGSFFKTGLGVIELTGSNTYNGGTEVLGGNLIFGGQNALSPNTWLTISNFATVGLGADFTGSLGTGSPGNVQWTGSGGFAANGADRIVNLGGATGQVTWGAGFFVPEVVDGSVLVLGATTATHTVDFQNPIDLGFSNRTVQVDNGLAAIDARLGGVLSGGALATETNLNKTGAGTLALTAANTYTGITLVSAGALRAQNNTALGVTNGGTIVNSGAVLELEGGTTIGNEPLSLGGTGIGGGGALRNVSGSNVFQGNILLTANTTFGSDAGTLVLDGAMIEGDSGGARSLTFNGPGDFVINNLVSNATTFNKVVGTGTLTLSGVSLHTGNTVIREGTLKLGADNVLPENSTYVANLTGSFAALDIAGRTEAIGALILGQNPTAGGSTNNVIDSVGGGLLRLGGTVTFDSGTAFTNAGSIISANLDLNNATRTFAVDDSALAPEDLVVSGSITNSGATPSGLIKTGVGTLVLSGANTYDGNTLLNATGAVVAANNLAFGSVGSVSLTNSGALLELANGITIDRPLIVESRGNEKTLALRAGATAATYAGDITILETGANNFDLSADASGTLTIAGVVGGAAGTGIEKVGAGTVVLTTNNTYSGPTVITAGILQVGNGGASGTLGTGAVTNNAALVFNRSNTHTVANAIRGTGVLTNAGAGTTILTAANNYSGGSVLTAGNLELQNAASAGSGAIRMQGGNLRLINNANTTFGNDVFVAENATITLARLSGDGGITHTLDDFTIADGRTLNVRRGTLTGVNPGYTLVADDVGLLGNATISVQEGVGNGNGTFDTDKVVGTNSPNQNLTVSGIGGINDAFMAVSEDLLLTGDLVASNLTMRLIDAGTNVQGNISLQNAVLSVGNDFKRELGTGDGQVQLTSGGNAGFSARGGPRTVRIEDGSGGLTNLVWGSPTFNVGTLYLNNSDANDQLTLENSIDFNVASAATRQITVDANTAIVSGALTNSGAGVVSFTKDGSGNLYLTGPAVAWNGQTRIAGGILRVSNVNVLASSLANSNLVISAANEIGALETTGILTNALGSGVGQVSLVGGTDGGQNHRNGFSAYGGDLTIDLGGDGTGTGPAVQWNTPGAFDPNGGSTNNGGLLLNTAQANGVLRFLNDMDLNGEANLVPAVRNIDVNGSIAVLSGDLSNSQAGTFPVGLRKRGAGILVLEGANSYDGITEVAAGALAVNGSHFGGGLYTVLGGAALAGTGTIGSAVLVASNAVMAPGNSIGIFTTTNNFTFSTGGVLQIELDHVLAASDRLVVSGALDIAGAILSLTNLGTGGDLSLLDDTYIIAEYGSLIGGSFYNGAEVLGLLPVGYTIDYNYLGASQIALVIPEPTSVATLMLGGIGLALLARRRRVSAAAREEGGQ